MSLDEHARQELIKKLNKAREVFEKQQNKILYLEAKLSRQTDEISALRRLVTCLAETQTSHATSTDALSHTIAFLTRLLERRVT